MDDLTKISDHNVIVAPKEPSKPILLYLHGGAYSHNFSESQWYGHAPRVKLRGKRYPIL